VVFFSQLLRNLHDWRKTLKERGKSNSRSDEIPEIVALLSILHGNSSSGKRPEYIRVPVVINEGQQTILDLDAWESKT